MKTAIFSEHQAAMSHGYRLSLGHTRLEIQHMTGTGHTSGAPAPQ